MAGTPMDHRLWTVAPQRKVIQGSFATDGAGAVGAAKGRGFVATKTGTGTYRLTLPRTYFDIESVVASIMKNDTTSDLVLRVQTYSVANSTIDLVVMVATVATNLVSGEIHFAVTVRDTVIA